jgi:hypothetical protein
LSPELLKVETNVNSTPSINSMGSSAGPSSKDESESSKMFVPESDDSCGSSILSGSNVPEGFRNPSVRKPKSGLHMLFKGFRKAFTSKSDPKLSNKVSQSHSLIINGSPISIVPKKDASDSSSESGSIRRNSLPKLKEPLAIRTSKISRQKSKSGQSSSPLSASPIISKKMFPTDKGQMKLCRICERFIQKTDFEQHSELCVLNHEYKVKMKDADNKLRKYVTILSSRRKMLKAVRIP